MTNGKQPVTLEDLIGAVVRSRPGDSDGKGRNSDAANIPYGFADLDKLTGGLKPGLTVVAGAPSVGRSTFAIQVALHAALAQARVLMFSLEATAREVAARMLPERARMPLANIESGEMTDEKREDLTAAARLLAGLGVVVCDDWDLDLDAFCQMAGQWARRREKQLIVVDGVELMRSAGGFDGEAVTRRLRRLAYDLEAPVLMTRVLDGERIQEVRTEEAGLRQFLNLATEIDAVDAFIALDRSLDECESAQDYAPEIYLSRVAVAKNRHGGQGMVELAFMPEFSRYMDYVS